MERRAAYSSDRQTRIFPGKAVASSLAGHKNYWSGPQNPPLLDLEKWIELFRVSTMAKYSISMTDLTRNEGGERILTLRGGLAEEVASKKSD